MATMTGKKARRKHGNRYACKRKNRKRNPIKLERWKESERRRKAKENHAA
jgi:hypothetical protein